MITNRPKTGESSKRASGSSEETRRTTRCTTNRRVFVGAHSKHVSIQNTGLEIYLPEKWSCNFLSHGPVTIGALRLAKLRSEVVCFSALNVIPPCVTVSEHSKYDERVSTVQLITDTPGRTAFSSDQNHSLLSLRRQQGPRLSLRITNYRRLLLLPIQAVRAHGTPNSFDLLGWYSIESLKRD